MKVRSILNFKFQITKKIQNSFSVLLILIIAFVAAAFTSGCASRQAYYPPRSVAPADRATTREGFKGAYHTVKKGQTLWRISKTYGVDLETLQWVNDVEDVTDLRVGRVLFIPGASTTLEMAPVPGEDEKPSSAKISLIWPVKGRNTSNFGPRGRRVHEGIDLAAPTGTPVLASASGRVAYSGNGMRGYGKVVVLKHTNDLSTVYAHNSSLLVRMGDSVAQGQTIAKVGATGRTTGPHLHFEIRRRGVPEDPRKFLSGL
jgi:murein DD-endopeptidase MepM/ murein hydrolase activator NlpD